MGSLAGVRFQDLSNDAQKIALTDMLLHLREKLGPVEGLGDHYDPGLIEYFIFRLRPLFRPDGNIVVFSLLYNPLSSRIYDALYKGYRLQKVDLNLTNRG